MTCRANAEHAHVETRGPARWRLFLALRRDYSNHFLSRKLFRVGILANGGSAPRHVYNASFETSTTKHRWNDLRLDQLPIDVLKPYVPCGRRLVQDDSNFPFPRELAVLFVRRRMPSTVDMHTHTYQKYPYKMPVICETYVACFQWSGLVICLEYDKLRAASLLSASMKTSAKLTHILELRPRAPIIITSAAINPVSLLQILSFHSCIRLRRSTNYFFKWW